MPSNADEIKMSRVRIRSSEKKVDGILFTEKTKTTVEGDLYGPELREKVHTRTIGEKVYTVVEVKPMNAVMKWRQVWRLP